MHETLLQEKLEDTGSKHDNAFLKFQSKSNVCPKFEHFNFFHEILRNEKFKGTDFKNNNSFLNSSLKNTQIKHFL